ncbi:MAG: hypothetical protein FJZ96_03400 [Chloroflexi bacterium]|nr:hypothetical protein [Chloroflexota bacterium]
MRHALLPLFTLALLYAACVPSGDGTSTSPCGDGNCSNPETAANCPEDCSAASSISNPDGDAPLFLTTMTHMEGNWDDDTQELVFLNHVEKLRYGMTLAEEYDAILTVESEKPFARANDIWDLNIMAEVEARGHGVGTHCDIGFKTPPTTAEEYSTQFANNKALVDALVGAEDNLGCSGGGSVNDWAIAASLAGFKYIDGLVSMHYLSMPLENRPSSLWTDDFIRSGNHHYNAPEDLYQRIYLYGVADAQDFVADPDPVIVISSGELGLLQAIAEQGRETGGTGGDDKDYILDQADVDALVDVILEVDRNRDRSKVAKLCPYLPANIFVPENETVLRYFFSEMQTLAEQGIITWASQRQVYEAYLDWNNLR